MRALGLWLLFILSAQGVSAASLTPGEPVPALELPVMVGEPGATVSLAELSGKVVYLDFWASWCGPCRVSFPQLEALRSELGPRGFEILAVNLDEFEADALKFLEQVPVSYPVVRDADGDTPAQFGVLGMPTGFLIDRDGVLRLIHQGYRKSDGEKLRQEIIHLLGRES